MKSACLWFTKKMPADKTAERVIIVDDEKRMCDSLAALLSDHGYRVSAFQNPEEAVRIISNEKVDLVIADIRMPRMGGLELLKVVKKVDDGIPVILMTGYAAIDTAIEAVSEGAYDYLLKPVEFAHLELIVKRALEKRKAELLRLQLMEELKLSNLILNRRISELNALYEAGKSIGSAANLKELLKQIVTLASNVTEAQVGSIMLLDDRNENLTIEAAIGLSQEIIGRTRLPIGASIAGYVAQTGEALRVEDVEKDEKFGRINRERYGAASLLCAPLKIKNKVIGVINMANKQEGESFSKNDLRLLVTFASQAAVMVDDANQFEKNKRRLVEFEILHEISSELPGIRSTGEFRGLLAKKLVRVFPIDYAVWFDYDQESKTLLPRGATGTKNIPLTESGGIDLRKVSREDITVTDVDFNNVNLGDIQQTSALIARRLLKHKNYPEPADAFMAVPILRQGEPVSVYCMGTAEKTVYSDDDISLARLVISQAALLYEKEQSLLNATRLITMGNMISEISHDLRRPLTSISGGLQVIRKRWPEIAKDPQLFKTVEGEIHRMNELVRELVDFSNPNKYQMEKIDLRQIVSRALELVRADFEKMEIKAVVSFEEADWEVMVNKNQVLAGILNLFHNSIDAMPDGGQLTVEGMIEKPEHKKEDYLAIKIGDSGKGIKKEDISRIFDRYFTTKETGTGLGLAAVERIISAHNGTLAVKSVYGQGATFTLYFPIPQ